MHSDRCSRGHLRTKSIRETLNPALVHLSTTTICLVAASNGTPTVRYRTAGNTGRGDRLIHIASLSLLILFEFIHLGNLIPCSHFRFILFDTLVCSNTDNEEHVHDHKLNEHRTRMVELSLMRKMFVTTTSFCLSFDILYDFFVYFKIERQKENYKTQLELRERLIIESY